MLWSRLITGGSGLVGYVVRPLGLAENTFIFILGSTGARKVATGSGEAEKEFKMQVIVKIAQNI